MFPAHLVIRVISAETQLAIPRLAVGLRLKAAAKNDYTFHCMVDAQGELTIARSAVEDWIREEQRAFPMDYQSSLAECTHLRAYTLTEEDIDRALAAAKLWGPALVYAWRSPQEIALLGAAPNGLYRPVSLSFRIASLPEDRFSVTLPVARMSRPGST
jgi:hypothetical protein